MNDKKTKALIKRNADRQVAKAVESARAIKEEKDRMMADIAQAQDARARSRCTTRPLRLNPGATPSAARF